MDNYQMEAIYSVVWMYHLFNYETAKSEQCDDLIGGTNRLFVSENFNNFEFLQGCP